MNISLSGKHIFITGGTGALGFELVKRCAGEQAQVYFTYNENSPKAQELEKLGAKGFQIDLKKCSAIDELKNKLKAETRELDAVIHNAAIVRDRTIQNMSSDEWDEVLDVNLKAVYYLNKKLLSFLFKKSGSKIIHIVSRVGISGGFGEANYAASKAGLMALTKSLAKELGKKQILVNALNPGFMKSAMTENLPKEIFQKNIAQSALETISDPKDVANFLIYMVSDHFKNVTGQVFHLDSRNI